MEDDDRQVLTRYPAVLLARIDAQVVERQSILSRYCRRDWMIEAAREKLDPAVTQISTGSAPLLTAQFEALFETKSKPGFGVDPLAFLARAKNQTPEPAEEVEDVDEWEQKCYHEFPGATKAASKPVRAGGVEGWQRLTWQQRYELLKENKERNGGTAWA